MLFADISMVNNINVSFWGVRGSVPSPGPETAKYGGNTPCIEISTDSQRVIIDAGTGIRSLGKHIVESEDYSPIHLFISHTHWDHIQGFPFFMPAFHSEYDIHVYGPYKVHEEENNGESFKEIMERQMDFSFFPVQLEEVEKMADIHYHPIGEEELEISPFEITTQAMNHTVYSLGYRIETEQASIAYTGDTEPYYDPFSREHEGDETEGFGNQEQIQEQIHMMNQRTVQFVRDADLLISDAQYTEEEYENRRGWGHSTIMDCIDLAVKGNVSNVIFFHHDPERTDDEIDRLETLAQEKIEKQSSQEIGAAFAREGLDIQLSSDSTSVEVNIS